MGPALLTACQPTSFVAFLSLPSWDMSSSWGFLSLLLHYRFHWEKGTTGASVPSEARAPRKRFASSVVKEKVRWPQNRPASLDSHLPLPLLLIITTWTTALITPLPWPPLAHYQLVLPRSSLEDSRSLGHHIRATYPPLLTASSAARSSPAKV